MATEHVMHLIHQPQRKLAVVWFAREMPRSLGSRPGMTGADEGNRASAACDHVPAAVASFSTSASGI